MEFSLLCSAYDNVAKTTKRLEKTWIVAELLKQTPEESLPEVMLLLKGRTYPEWDKTTTGVSQKLVIKAISLTTGISSDEVIKKFKELGDLGEVAAALVAKKTQATLFSQSLAVHDVIKTIRKIATVEGQGSVDQKLKNISQLLSNASQIEAQYLIRIVLEDLRIGIADGTIRDAIVWRSVFDQEGMGYSLEKNEWSGDQEKLKVWSEAVQNAIDRSNDVAKVAKIAKEGLGALQKIELEMGVPTRVMLAQRSLDIQDAFKRAGTPCAVEYKYDGFRMIVHKFTDGTVELFTRRLENVTKQFPDVVAVLQEEVVQSCILDCEVVGYERDTGRHAAFQHISQRIRRKYDIRELAEKLPVELNVFDILQVDGKQVYHLPFSERRAMIEELIPHKEFKIKPSTKLESGDENEVQEFYQKALDAGMRD